jgi:hypothetical protein
LIERIKRFFQSPEPPAERVFHREPGALVVDRATGEDQTIISVFCVCSEEWCWCSNRVSVILPRGTNEVRAGDFPCPECAEGHHVWIAGGTR